MHTLPWFLPQQSQCCAKEPPRFCFPLAAISEIGVILLFVVETMNGDSSFSVTQANSFLFVCSRGLVNNTLLDHLSSESVEKRDKPGQLQQANPLYTGNAEMGEGGFYLCAGCFLLLNSRMDGLTPPNPTALPCHRHPSPARQGPHGKGLSWTCVSCGQITSQRKSGG